MKQAWSFGKVARAAAPYSLVVILSFLGLSLFLLTLSQMPREGSSVRLSELRAELTRGIEEDPVAAYQSLKQGYTPDKFEESHVIAHMFGEILYEVYGVGGIEICDTDFNFGCYHGFVSAAVAHGGFDVAGALRVVCTRFSAPEFDVCTHGLGHGMLEYLGEANIVDALEACEGIDDAGPLGGCMSGVFMGYNVALSLDTETNYEVARRPLVDAANPYAPCDVFTSPTFAEACYHELPRWWKHVYPQDYAVFGGFCAELDGANRTACYVGIAKVIPSASNFDVARAEALCDQVGNGDVYTNCIVRAAWSLYTNNRDPERAASLCAFAPEYARSECPV